MKRIDYGLAFMLQFENVAWYENGMVKILDRRVYPQKVHFVKCKEYGEVVQAIRNMVTQSAGPYTAAGMAMALAAFQCRNKKREEQLAFLKMAADAICHARPTTKDRMKQVTDGCLKVAEKEIDQLDQKIFQHTLQAMENRYQRIYKVATHLVPMIPCRGSIITQCFGETIVGMMLKVAKEENKIFNIFCPETRPFLQGARFTATVCKEMGFQTTVITDNMVAAVMQEKSVDLFTSAADSICLDGYVVNKVGTFQMAIVANYLNIPYFVTGIPDVTKKIDSIEIEYRDPQEVLSCNGIIHTQNGVLGLYPSFDITPPKLINGVVTDQGIFSPYNLKNYEDKSYNFYSFAV